MVVAVIAIAVAWIILPFMLLSRLTKIHKAITETNDHLEWVVYELQKVNAGGHSAETISDPPVIV